MTVEKVKKPRMDLPDTILCLATFDSAIIPPECFELLFCGGVRLCKENQRGVGPGEILRLWRYDRKTSKGFMIQGSLGDEAWLLYDEDTDETHLFDLKKDKKTGLGETPFIITLPRTTLRVWKKNPERKILVERMEYRLGWA